MKLEKAKSARCYYGALRPRIVIEGVGDGNGVDTKGGGFLMTIQLTDGMLKELRDRVAAGKGLDILPASVPPEMLAEAVQALALDEHGSE